MKLRFNKQDGYQMDQRSTFGTGWIYNEVDQAVEEDLESPEDGAPEELQQLEDDVKQDGDKCGKKDKM